MGVPHPEVGVIQVNAQRQEWGYVIQGEDQIVVFPRDFKKISERGMADIRFILDVHLGKLAHYLRMLGYDSAYQNDLEDERLAELSEKENRVLLTRDRQLLMRKQVEAGYWVRSLDPKEQLSEIRQVFGLGATSDQFKRCMECNGRLVPVEKEAILDRLEPLTRKFYHEFWVCPDCERVYWAGSHLERMSRLVNGA